MGGAERAVLEFHSQTANVANMLLGQFRELYGKELSKGDLDNSQKAIDHDESKLQSWCQNQHIKRCSYNSHLITKINYIHTACCCMIN